MSDDVLAQLEAARAQVDAQIAAAEQRRDAAHRMADDIKELTVTASSPRGEATVTAAPGGGVTAVRIADAALSLGAVALSRLVTETIAQAQRKAALAAVERSAEVLGEASAFVTELRSQVDQSFPGADPGLQWK